MAEILSPEELARLNGLIQPEHAARSAKKIAAQLWERQAAWARGDMSNMSGKILALAATIIEWQHDRIKALERPHGDGSAIVTLSPENFDAFLAHCENPAPPNEALRELVRKVRVAKGLSRDTSAF